MSQSAAINPLVATIDSQSRVTVNSEVLNEQNKVLLNATLAAGRLQAQQFITQSMMAGVFIPMEVPSFLGG